MDESTIGARLRVLRRWRGMTLAELAGQAGVTAGFLSMAERDLRVLDRRSHIAALAAALRVSETELTGGPHLSVDRDRSGPHAGVPALRAALATNMLGEAGVETARPVDELVALVERIEGYRQACDYAAIGAQLPTVLDELHHHVAADREQARRAALGALVPATMAAGDACKGLGYMDLAHLAALRGCEAAERLGDPLAQAQAMFLRVLTMPRSGAWDRHITAARRAADTLQGQAGARTAVALQTYGMLHLAAALFCAGGNKLDDAEAHLAEATSTAARVNERADAWQQFGPTNCGIWRITVTVEYGDAPKAIELADHVDPTMIPARSRRAGYYAELGRGLARSGKTRPAAVRALRRAEEIAPQRIRNSPAARETVRFLLGRAIADAGGRDLRGMAARMGISH